MGAGSYRRAQSRAQVRFHANGCHAQKACGKSNVRAHALPASVGDNGRWIARGELGWCLQAVAQVVWKMPRAPRANRITHRITA